MKVISKIQLKKKKLFLYRLTKPTRIIQGGERNYGLQNGYFMRNIS
jgi:hypothetical protein